MDRETSHMRFEHEIETNWCILAFDEIWFFAATQI
jgi:hypothetical protein